MLSKFRIDFAEKLIQANYGDTVKVGSKKKTLDKFGRSDNLSTSEFELVSKLGQNEVYLTDNLVDTVSSDNASDTQSVRIEGHTVDVNGNFTFVIQLATLDGQNKVPLITPLARVTRFYNDSSTDFAGEVYVYEDDTVIGGTPQTADKIHAVASGLDNQTLKAATTISKDDYWIIHQLALSVTRQQTGVVDFRLQIREKGKVFRTKKPISVHSNQGTIIYSLDVPIIVPKNSDVQVVALASSANMGATAIISGYLAKIQN